METNERITNSIAEDIKRLTPIIGKNKAAKLQTAFLLGDESYRKRIMEIIDALKATVVSDEALKESVLIQPPERHVATTGDFQLGTVLYGQKELYPLGFNKEDLLTHIGIFGSSGSGKTNIIHYLTAVLNDLGIPILIFDFSKRNYRDLLQIPELKDKVKVYTVGRDAVPFRFNPLKPPEGVQISQWAKEFAEVFDHAYWLLGGGRHVILKALDGLYRMHEPSIPRMQDLKKWVDKLGYAGYGEVSSRERNWVSTAKRPLEALCMRETGEIFDCDEGLKPDKFFVSSGVTILELDALSNDDKTFFIEIILQWIRDWLLVSNKREKLQGVIVLEEAHHVLNREKTKKFGVETVTDLIFREIRELGIGMVYVDQHPSLVSYPALGNTSTHIYMNLGLDTKYSSDIQDASNMLGLRTVDEKDYLRRLPIGNSFILIRKSVFPNPFLLKFPLMKLEKGLITDANVRSHMGDELLKEIREKREAKETDDITSETDGVASEIEMKSETEYGTGTRTKKIVSKQVVEDRAKRVNSRGWQIIEAMSKGEGAYTSELYKTLKMSHKTFNAQAKKLVDIGFANCRQARVYKRTAVYYFLTREGRLAFALKNGKCPQLKSDVDLEKMKTYIVEALTLKGWDLKAKGERHLSFRIDEKNAKVGVITSLDEEVKGENVRNELKNGEAYFVCGSERIKNAIMQEVAKFSFEHKGMNLIVFVATLEDLKKGDGLKKIEFDAETGVVDTRYKRVVDVPY